MIIEYYKVNDKIITIIINYNDIMIYNSKDIKSITEMNKVITHIFNKYNYKFINNNSNRTKFSLLNEWRTHNLLYDLNLFRNHTKDVNFEYNQNKILAIIYTFFSIFYFHYN